MKTGNQKKTKVGNDLRGHGDLRAQIEARAYHLWLVDGCPHGNDLYYWLEAEREISKARPTRPDL